MQSEMNRVVEQYLADSNEDHRAALTVLRQTIRNAAPDAEETFQFGMPTYFQTGMVCAFADRGSDMTFYVGNARVLDPYKNRFQGATVETGCVRFRQIGDLPLEIIERIVKDSVRFHQNPRT